MYSCLESLKKFAEIWFLNAADLLPTRMVNHFANLASWSKQVFFQAPCGVVRLVSRDFQRDRTKILFFAYLLLGQMQKLLSE